MDDRTAWDKLPFSIGQFRKERRLACAGCFWRLEDLFWLPGDELSFTSWMYGRLRSPTYR
jgi:hypothetical protein